MRKHLGLGVVGVLLGVGLSVYLLFGDELSFYVRLYNTYRTAKRFYSDYEGLARNIAFHTEMEPRLDVYSPATGTGHPVLVFVHGGSWKDYNKELFAPVAMKLLPLGMVVVIPDYTLYPEAGYERMAQEVAAALSWTLENIEQYGGDPGRVVVTGHSAGAHLLGLAVMDPRFLSTYGHRGTEFCGLVGMSGVYDVQAEHDFWLAKGETPRVMLEVMGGRENLAQASPIRYVGTDLPPILLIHGEQDETVPVSIAAGFHAALQAAGAQSELKVYAGAGHTDYLFAALSEEQPRLVMDLADFVHRCSGASP